MNQLVPSIRFPEYNGNYCDKKIEDILDRVVKPVELKENTDYVEIGIRSHGRGLFHKKPTTSIDIGDKRVFWIEPDLFIVNIVFAWEQAVAKTTNEETGKIASHRFPMFKTKKSESVLDYLVWLFLTKRGKYLLGLASPGGAGRNKTLGQKQFDLLKVRIPIVEEQQKIAGFLSAVDKKTSLLKQKHSLLLRYKKGVMQQLFSQKIRFKDGNGDDFPQWHDMKLNELLYEHKVRNSKMKFDKVDVLSVSGEKGIVNQIEHLGRSYAGESVANYHVVHHDDIVYTKSPLKANPYGIIKANKGKPGIVSTLYAVYSCKDTACADYIEYYFCLDDNLNRYLRPLVHKGAKNDMKINNQRVLIDTIMCPSKKEQEKIVLFLDQINAKINFIKQQLQLTQTFKKGLLQQMFV